MRNLGIGPIGIATGLDSSPASLAAAVAVEELGYPTLWLSGGALPGLRTVVDLVRATSTLKIATGILSVDTYSPADVAATYAGIEAEQPGRFLVGLGGAHGPRPLATLKSFLDQLDAVPQEAKVYALRQQARVDAVPQKARILAALGPRMLELARDRTAGAYPVLVTPEYTAQARTILGDDRTLAVQQFAVVETDADRARAMAREPIAFLSKVPGYAANLARMGFSADEIDRLDDRLVDALTAWGDPSAIAARVAEHHEAGADHVSINVLTGVTGPQPIEQWRALTRVLLS